jgi:hypothetical protein
MGDAQTFDHLLLEDVDEARRRGLDAETAATILRNHAENLEERGYDDYAPASGLPEEVEDA